MPARRSSRHGLSGAGSQEAPGPVAPPRIIGGDLRGKKLLYSGDSRTRPMKDRVREAVFNVLGPRVAGKHALDLFAGTGALGFEALSRGAALATLVERHFPTADLIRQTAAALGVSERTHVAPANAFIWVQRDLPSDDRPWLAFVCPPWALFAEQPEAMLALVERLMQACPPESILVVETDTEHPDVVPQPEAWRLYHYSPATIAVFQRPREG